MADRAEFAGIALTSSLLDAVVVGFDGSTGSEQALAWAAREARRRGRRLHVIHVWLPPPLVPAGLSFPHMPDSEAILDDAVARAGSIWPDGTVTAQALPGPVDAAFIDASLEADTVVVGAPCHRRQAYRDFGSSAWQVAIHALCPVVVVPETTDPCDHRAVVVGVDGSAGSDKAVAYDKWPEKQQLAKSSQLLVSVRNAGRETIPNIGVTVNGLDERKTDPDLADPTRPVFAINGVQVRIAGFPESKDAAPRGCDTAYVNTWACGPLKPNQTKTFRWSVTAVRAGDYRVTWRVNAGLDGKAKAVASGGGPAPRGQFAGTISNKAPTVRVADDGHTIVNGTR